MDERAIFAALSEVDDPELGLDIISLGLVYGVVIEGPHVQLRMTLTRAACPAAGQIEVGARIAVAQLDGVESVEIDWTFDPPWTVDRVTQEGRDYLETMGWVD